MRGWFILGALSLVEKLVEISDHDALAHKFGGPSVVEVSNGAAQAFGPGADG